MQLLLLALLAIIASVVHADPIPAEGHGRLTRYEAHTGPSETGGLAHSMPMLVRRAVDPVTVAKNYLEQKLGVKGDGYIVQDSFTDDFNGVTHLHAMQVVQGTEVVNGIAGVAVDKQNNVISFYDTFASTAAVAALKARASTMPATDAVSALGTYLASKPEVKLATPTANAPAMATAIDAVDAAVTWVKNAAFASDKVWTKPRLFATESGDLKWVVDVRAQTPGNWVNAQVGPAGAVLGLVDWSAAALYRVFPAVGFASDPSEGGRALVQDPEDVAGASPKGWSTAGFTKGNNAEVHQSPLTKSPRAQVLAQGAIDPTLNKLSFDFSVNPADGNPKGSLDASLANAFYITNLAHDLYARYGFTEQAGNFQDVNFSGKGKGGDSVIVNVQDESSLNNANFQTPPDGQRPVLNAFLFDLSGTITDGSLSDDIILHENTHGVVGRLVGGGSNPNCLASLESGGLNEGWADIVAVMLKQKKEFTRAHNTGVAPFNTGKAGGIRTFPYSTSLSANPQTYANAAKQTDVHGVGEIWAEMLYEAYFNVVDKNGFEADWRKAPASVPAGTKIGGNIMFMQNIIDGLKLAPCNPTFITARNAIIQADQQNFKGANVCDLWKGFAKRGLGVKAGSIGKADFSVPASCVVGKRMVRF
ncbi:Fungalysin metallopeptidase-domain-containing protein [Blastocladiella britannica]|nr:Fungalysin metallopeptidase-domain-containing protein [Blastocladiella britannica]